MAVAIGYSPYVNLEAYYPRGCAKSLFDGAYWQSEILHSYNLHWVDGNVAHFSMFYKFGQW